MQVQIGNIDYLHGAPPYLFMGSAVDAVPSVEFGRLQAAVELALEQEREHHFRCSRPRTFSSGSVRAVCFFLSLSVLVMASRSSVFRPLFFVFDLRDLCQLIAAGA
ncbi:MAG: hypothetical protein U5K84_06470 [Alkalibacterium sp.]|nr:hypothetical protein [Alkalibacterium sp.]